MSIFNLEFSEENLRYVLKEIVSSYGAKYSHHDLAEWCAGFLSKYYNEEIGEGMNSETVHVAEDIDTQWELFLTNQYFVHELKEIDVSKIQMPMEWFRSWLDRMPSDSR